MQLRAKSAFPVRAWVCSTSGGATMLDMAATAADRLGQILTDEFKRNFGSGHSDRAERLGSIARVALECLARSDALYHTVEHTFLVTLVGLDIMRGRSLSVRIAPDEFNHVLIACLLHDIGYVRGILKGDGENSFVIDDTGRTVALPRGSSDASLGPYHVNRSKIFAHQRLEHSPLDAGRIARAIEFTRFRPEITKPRARKTWSRDWCKQRI